VPPAREHPDQAKPWADFPLAAGSLAEVTRRDTRESVMARTQLHVFQQRPGALLEGDAGGDEIAGLLDSGRQPITFPLQLAEAEQRRNGTALESVDVCREVREAIREDCR